MSSDNAKHPYSSSERRETLPQIQEDGDSSEELTFEQYRQRKNASGTIPYNLPEHNWKVDLKTVTSSPKDEKKRSSRKIHVSPRVDKKISQRSLIGDSKAMLNVSINDSVDINCIWRGNHHKKITLLELNFCKAKIFLHMKVLSNKIIQQRQQSCLELKMFQTIRQMQEPAVDNNNFPFFPNIFNDFFQAETFAEQSPYILTYFMPNYITDDQLNIELETYNQDHMQELITKAEFTDDDAYLQFSVDLALVYLYTEQDVIDDSADVGQFKFDFQQYHQD